LFDDQFARMPRPVEGVDPRRLPIGPEEAFVLSRVDGRSSEAEIAAATGLDAAHVRATLTRLVELGAVQFGGPVQPAPRPVPERSITPGTKLSRPVVEARDDSTRTAQHHPAAALYDPGELDEAVDIDLPRRRRILDTFYRLDALSHYELLAVTASADKKEIKQAYYQAVGLFHPDKYFGKKLGSFKPKLERLFARLTEAHDVLTKRDSRQAYDRYLATQQRNEDSERLLGDEQARAAEVDRAEQLIAEEARIAERASHAAPPRSVPPATSRPIDQDARKRALARKLGKSPTPSRPSMPSVDQSQIREHVTDELRRRYQQRVTLARKKQIEHYLQAADQALDEKNLASAANALRVAASLAPNDAELAARLEQVQQQVNVDLAESYLEQGRYEERSGRLIEAAVSYQRAARGRPDPRLFERAASCLLEGKGDLRRAGELARKAVSLAPGQAEPRVTLARVYLGAGMRESALKEFERAAELSPGDDSIKDWIKRVRRGEV
jgi:curved DNA-binding protein CbpA